MLCMLETGMSAATHLWPSMFLKTPSCTSWSGDTAEIAPTMSVRTSCTLCSCSVGTLVAVAAAVDAARAPLCGDDLVAALALARAWPDAGPALFETPRAVAFAGVAAGCCAPLDASSRRTLAARRAAERPRAMAAVVAARGRAGAARGRAGRWRAVEAARWDVVGRPAPAAAFFGSSGKECCGRAREGGARCGTFFRSPRHPFHTAHRQPNLTQDAPTPSHMVGTRGRWGPPMHARSGRSSQFVCKCAYGGALRGGATYRGGMRDLDVAAPPRRAAPHGVAADATSAHMVAGASGLRPKPPAAALLDCVSDPPN
eukprot:126986-Chlamydomonas_euryale.AAC.8